MGHGLESWQACSIEESARKLQSHAVMWVLYKVMGLDEVRGILLSHSVML